MTNRVRWSSTDKSVPRPLAKLARKCEKTREEYYLDIAAPVPSAAAAWHHTPCVSCSLPYSHHRVNRVCKDSREQVESHRDPDKPQVPSNRCTTCGHYVSSHRIRVKNPPTSAATTGRSGVNDGRPRADKPSNTSSSCYTCTAKKVICNGTDSSCLYRTPGRIGSAPPPQKRQRPPAPPSDPSEDDDNSGNDNNNDDDENDDNNDGSDNNDDDEVVDVDNDKNNNTETKPKRLHLRRFKKVKQETPVGPCPFTYEELVRYTKSAEDLLKTCTYCAHRVKDHAREVIKGKEKVKQPFRLPDQKYFPIFRDAKNPDMKDPGLFLRKLDRQLNLHDIPRGSWEKILVSCVTEDLMQEWIENHLVDKDLEWNEVKTLFTNQFTDPALRNNLDLELQNTTQDIGERAHQYNEKYDSLITRLGYDPKSQSNIVACERGYVPAIRVELAKLKAQNTFRDKKQFLFACLQDLYDASTTIELGLAPTHGRRQPRPAATGTTRGGRKGSKRGGRAHLNRLEMSGQGVPVNVNKKKKSGPSRPSSSPRGGRGGFPSGNSFRGARGGSSGTRGGQGGRGGHSNPRGAPGSERWPRSTTPTFTGKCFVCEESGHKADDCPKRTSSTANMHMLAAPTTPMDRALSASVVAVSQHMRRGMYITSPLMPGRHSVLNDTGAQFSAVSKRHATANRLHIHRPRADEVKYLSLADKSITVPRLGYVKLPVIVYFSGGKPRAPYRCTKQFEVLNMDYDFILGVDILPHIFQHDEIMDHLMLPSRITTPPQPLIGSIACDTDHETIRSSVSQFSGPTTLSYAEASQDEGTADSINEYVGQRVEENVRHLLGFGVEDLIENLDQLDISTDGSVPTTPLTTFAHVSAYPDDDMDLDMVTTVPGSAGDSMSTEVPPRTVSPHTKKRVS